MRRCDGTLRRCAGAIYGEIKRRNEVVGVFPNEAAVTRLIAALLLEQNDESTVQRAR
jgi:putative transposase